MALKRIAIALAALALLPGAAPASTADQFVEVFRSGCLAHLPDFSGSAKTFEELGFAQDGARFKRESDGSKMLAEIYDRPSDGGRGCVVASDIPKDAQVVPAVEALVTQLSGNDFERHKAEREGRRADAFTWQSGQWSVLVVVLPRISGMQALNVTVGKAR